MTESKRVGIVSIVGAECSGKTTLARALAQELAAVQVGESLRVFVEVHDRVPDREEQADLVATHRQAEMAAMEQADALGRQWVVSDAGGLMTAIYSIAYYADDSLLVDALTAQETYTLTVWCRPDFAWQPDQQRDGPEYRERVDHLLSDSLAKVDLPLLQARGSLAQRLDAVRSWLQNNSQQNSE